MNLSNGQRVNVQVQAEESRLERFTVVLLHCLMVAIVVGCGRKSDTADTTPRGGGEEASPVSIRKPDTVSRQSGKSASNGRTVTLVTREISLGKQAAKCHSSVDAPKPQFSPDCRRVAYAEERDDFSRAWVVLDGVKQKEYNWGGRFGRVQFSPDSKRAVYAAQDDGKYVIVLDGVEIKKSDTELAGPSFSPNSKRMVYLSIRNNKVSVVIDGVEGASYDNWGNSISLFSPDSLRVGYMACRDGNWFSVVNGVEGKQHRCDFAEDLQFSPDNSRVVYCLERGEKKEKRVVVVDGVEGKEYENSHFAPQFSASGQRIAYIGNRAGKSLVVVDGIESKEYDDIDGIGGPDDPFSPDGKRIAYAAKRDGKSLAVIDGKEERAYEAMLLRPRFSPDSKHVSYVAKDGGKSVLVIDGQEQQRFDDVLCTPTLSPDGLHLAYSVKRGDKFVVGLDGVESKEPNDVGPPVSFMGDWLPKYNPLAFSPDSRRLAYRARRGKERIVVVDGVAGPSYDDVETVAFTSDSKRVIYIAERGKKRFLVVDGVVGNLYDDFIIHDEFYTKDPAHIVMDTPTSLHTIAVRNNEVLCVEIEIVEP